MKTARDVYLGITLFMSVLFAYVAWINGFGALAGLFFLVSGGGSSVVFTFRGFYGKWPTPFKIAMWMLHVTYWLAALALVIEAD